MEQGIDASREDGRWPQRTWTLGFAGAIVGWAVFGLLGRSTWFFDWSGGAERAQPWRLTLATWAVVAGIAFAITWTRRRPLWALGFAALVGLVVAEVVAVGGGFPWDFLFGWRVFFAILAVLIAAPFVQQLRDTWQPAGGVAFDYPRLHAAAWTDAVLIFAALLFVGLVWLLAWLLAGLFGLAGVSVLARLLARAGTFWVLSGGALGTGFGLLREREAILTALQRVVVLVFAAVAPVVAAGFALFVLALLVTGLHPLWQATKTTTPLLVTASAVAVLLANAVIADRAEDEPTNPVLRWAAVLLALVLPVFALIAAVSTGLRVRQYGLTPDRLWAITFSAIASAYALGYVVSLVRGFRAGTWMDYARQANIRLALGLCALGLLLSTPLVDFGALAVRSQVARLESGRVTPDKFDWTALRFDFGSAGVDALKRLAASPNAAVASRAKAALAAKDRYAFRQEALPRAVYPLGPRLRRPAGTPPTDPALVAAIDKNGLCTGPGRCFVETTLPDEALVIYEGSQTQAGDYSSEREGSAVLFHRSNKGWQRTTWLAGGFQYGDKARRERWRAAFDRGDFAIKPVERRQLFVGGQGDGDVIE